MTAARDGDAGAWKQLVDGHAGLVWSVIRGFRFDEETSKDAFQTVWLRLAEHLDRIRDPSKLASWLGQTTRNECVGLVRQRSRIVLTDGGADGDGDGQGRPAPYPAPGERLEREEHRRAVAAAFERLPERCQELLRLLVVDPPVSYTEISELLDVPIGSIGPTRSRCLDSMRTSPEITRITEGLRSS
ncbi:MAG: sigma-70 family RNA polymerase sigma factor [Actinomycetia bacterium]|nr:sigma-70 family RNA polymerase sigma factor [Actinomycetes bacterium]